MQKLYAMLTLLIFVRAIMKYFSSSLMFVLLALIALPVSAENDVHINEECNSKSPMLEMNNCASLGETQTIDYGKGDSIRLVGGADNFDCDDPAYANVKKVRTWTMQFADGSSKFLCSTEESVAAEKAAAESTSRQGTSQGSE